MCGHFEVSLIPVDSFPANSFKGNGRRCGIYGVARDISVQKLNNDRLAFLAFHDTLTGLPNRALYCDRVGLAIVQAKRNRMKVASMFVDLDRFKLANDTFGHQKGDELLKEAAGRLQNSLRETDTLARIGGDEFTILLPGLRTREDAACVADKLVSDMAKPFALAGIEVFLTASAVSYTHLDVYKRQAARNRRLSKFALKILDRESRRIFSIISTSRF